MSGALDNQKDPEFTVIARVAAVVVGRIVSPLSPSLHLTLLIKDLYEGIIGIDGQPDGGFRISGFERIKSNFYTNTVPNHLLTHNNKMTVTERLKYSNPKDIEIPIRPPNFITPREALHNSLRSALARPRAVHCVAFFANRLAIGCKKTPCGLSRSAPSQPREGYAELP